MTEPVGDWQGVSGGLKGAGIGFHSFSHSSLQICCCSSHLTHTHIFVVVKRLIKTDCGLSHSHNKNNVAAWWLLQQQPSRAALWRVNLLKLKFRTMEDDLFTLKCF